MKLEKQRELKRLSQEEETRKEGLRMKEREASNLKKLEASMNDNSALDKHKKHQLFCYFLFSRNSAISLGTFQAKLPNF